MAKFDNLKLCVWGAACYRNKVIMSYSYYLKIFTRPKLQENSYVQMYIKANTGHQTLTLTFSLEPPLITTIYYNVSLLAQGRDNVCVTTTSIVTALARPVYTLTI